MRYMYTARAHTAYAIPYGISLTRLCSARTLQACVRDIHEIHLSAATNSLQGVRKKYATAEFGGVSNVTPDDWRMEWR